MENCFERLAGEGIDTAGCHYAATDRDIDQSEAGDEQVTDQAG